MHAKRPGNGPQQGGFARSVATQDRDDRALGNLEGDAPQRPDGSPVADRELGDLQQTTPPYPPGAKPPGFRVRLGARSRGRESTFEGQNLSDLAVQVESSRIDP